MDEKRLELIENNLKRLDRLILENRAYLEELIESKLADITNEKKHNIQHDIPSGIDSLSSLQLKIEYLTSANEQMVQQNQRLREYIENVIDKNEVPTKEDYFRALRGDV
ncbi:hypothetical protein [Bacillus sp. FJAT-45350]|uniref:hypothetical protein n=1 Tax=Bacillus sp. FJAT-45350 TaxID=2011014 RepID=UPI000BB9B8B8|nr:hypothetical protein [Bacillus sp. FJAT-45350]